MDDLRQLFFRSFEQFAEREAENILHGTSERNLCARWAPLLEMAAVEAGYSGYRADTEYNRKQGGQVKTILDETMHVVRITCDLILHSRTMTSGRRTDERCRSMCAAMGSVISSNSMQMGDDSDSRNISAAAFQPKWTGHFNLPAHVASASEPTAAFRITGQQAERLILGRKAAADSRQPRFLVLRSSPSRLDGRPGLTPRRERRANSAPLR